MTDEQIERVALAILSRVHGSAFAKSVKDVGGVGWTIALDQALAAIEAMRDDIALVPIKEIPGREVKP